MRRNALIVLLLCCICCFPARAANYSGRQLQIERGKASIEMRAGEKRVLKVYRMLTGLRIHRGLYYASSNLLVATVDADGVLRGGLPGRAYVTVTDSGGRSDSILVIVRCGSKAGLWGAAAAVLVIGTLLWLIRGCHK